MTNEEFQRLVLQQMSEFKNQMSEFKDQMAEVRSQLDENTQFIKVLLHRTEELDAKLDGLLHTTVTKDMICHLPTKEDIAALDSKIEVINSRLFHQEAEIVPLKAIK